MVLQEVDSVWVSSHLLQGIDGLVFQPGLTGLGPGQLGFACGGNQGGWWGARAQAGPVWFSPVSPVLGGEPGECRKDLGSSTLKSRKVNKSEKLKPSCS